MNRSKTVDFEMKEGCQQNMNYDVTICPSSSGSVRAVTELK